MFLLLRPSICKRRLVIQAILLSLAAFFIFFTAHANPATLKLTEAEQKWLAEHGKVSFTGDPNWLPFEAFDEDGNYIGIVAEHLALLSTISGIEFDIEPSQTWTEATLKAKQGLVDILSETDDSDLKSHLNFTNPYVSNPIVIAMRNNENYVEGLTDIEGKRIGLIKDYGYASKIRRKYTELDFITVDDIHDGLLAVSTGEIDALICTLALCSYTISSLNLNNVRITGKTEFDTKLAFGVQQTLPELLSILNKAIDSISHEQRQAILDAWIKDKFAVNKDYTLFYQTLAASLALLGFFVLWNRRLAREVKLRIEIERARDQAEKVLRSQAKIINQIHDSVISVDLDGFIKSWNVGAERLFGYSAEEQIGQHISNVYRPEDHDFLENHIIKELKEKGSLEVESLVVKKNGETFFQHLSLSMLYDDEGQPSGMIGYSMDINERKKAEEEISRLASIVKRSQDFIGIADIDGKVQFLNDAGKQLVGISSDEQFFSTTIVDYFPEEERERVKEVITQQVLKEGRWSGEIYFRHFMTDEKIPVWYDAFRIDHPETGEPLSMATVTRDIRERREYEQALQMHRDELELLVEQRTKALVAAREEAERSSKAKSEFLSRMSHELRTPLNAILGFSQMLELDLDTFNDAHQGSIQEILEAGSHLLVLINELLDLAAIESGKLKIALENVSLQDVLKPCLTLMVPEAAKNNIELIEGDGLEQVILVANAVRLKQVLLNLVSNAIKYNSRNGSVRVDGKHTENGYFRLSISDTGEGLSEGDIAKLFTSFERIHEAGETQGTGIGLVITKYLVEHMAGCIGVDSVKGQGSTFWVELRLADTQNGAGRVCD